MNNIKLLSEYNITEISILIFIIIFYILSLYFIIPYINISIKAIQKSKKIKNRKEMIKKIAMQKDID